MKSTNASKGLAKLEKMKQKDGNTSRAKDIGSEMGRCIYGGGWSRGSKVRFRDPIGLFRSIILTSAQILESLSAGK